MSHATLRALAAIAVGVCMVTSCGKSSTEADSGTTTTSSTGTTTTDPTASTTLTTSTTDPGTSTTSTTATGTTETGTTTTPTTTTSTTTDTGTTAATMATTTGACRDATGMFGDCGNGQIDVGEQCDGCDLQGFDCPSLGYVGGTLQCDPMLCVFDTSMCF